MKIDSQNIEFGYELLSVIPHAYWLHKNKKLRSTRSGNDTKALYYFSPFHEINPAKRDWSNTAKVKYPNIWIHKPYFDWSQSEIPPYKEHYANKEYKWNKETVVICNRHNEEWGRKPLNYFSLTALEKMFRMLQDLYQVVYINVDGYKELYDNAAPMPLGDFDLLKKFPKVINFHDLCKGKSFNETQLKVFANCEKYVTMNGGHAILASFFGGENIIMSKYDQVHAREITENVNSFYTFYHEFSGQRCVHARNETELLNRIKIQWIDKLPICNILIRTNNRPIYFHDCMKSIDLQTYPNINVFLAVDSDHTKYHVPYKCYPVRVKTEEVPKPDNWSEGYGVKFPWNLYLNKLLSKVKSGLVMYLDDDDKFLSPYAVEKIMKEYKSGADFILWRVQYKARLIPNDMNFGKAPVCRDISGIGFAHDSKANVIWEGYKLGDFRIARDLWKTSKKIRHINETLTGMQDGAGFGQRQDKKIENMEPTRVIMIKPNIGSKYKKDYIYEMPHYMAKQFVRSGQAVYEIKETETVKIPVKPVEIAPIIEEKTEITEQKEQKKRGRKPKAA